MGYLTLTDTCAMPFGKYKGTPMQDVPPSYLHYLWQNGMKENTDNDSVANYIKRSLSALRLENKDLIWS